MILGRLGRVRALPAIIAAVVVLGFGLALFLWIGSSPGGPLPAGLPVATATISVGPGVPSAEPSPPTTDAGGEPTRSVDVTVTSDRRIPLLGYVLVGGHPSRAGRRDVGSPVHLHLIGHGYGVIVRVTAQAAPDASTLTCSVRVDGAPPIVDRTSQGFGVVECVA